MAFGDLELALEMALWKVLGGTPRRVAAAQALTAEMSFDRKVHALVSILRETSGSDHKAEMNAFATEMFDAQQERNALLHSAWSYAPQYESVVRIKTTAKAKQGFKRSIHRMSVAELDRVRLRISAAVKRVEKLAAKCESEAS